MNKKLIFAILTIIVLDLTACSPKPPEPVEVTIEMSEYAFSPSDLNFEVGQEVTINLVNVGSLDHEIMFGRGVAMTDNRPDGYQIDLFEEAGVEPVVVMGDMDMDDDHEEGEEAHDDGDMDMDDDHAMHSGFMVLLPPNSQDYSIHFTVTEEMVGEWEIGCFELDGVHYDAGMFGTLSITN